jgi:hypothetical protein
MMKGFLKGQCSEIFDFRFFHESVSFNFVSKLEKIMEIFAGQDAPAVSLTPVANGKKSSITKVLIIFF